MATIEAVGDNRPGFLAVALCASFSLLACGALLAYVAISCLVHLLRGKGRFEEASAPRVVRLLDTQFGALFLNLVLADLIQAFGFAENWQWLALGGIDPVDHAKACDTQAAAIEMGDVGSALWSLVIGIHTFCCLVVRWQPPRRAIVATIVLMWSTIILLGFIGPAALENGKHDPFYSTAGGWCWIGEAYQTQRFLMQYTFIFAALFANAILYATAFLVIRRRGRRGGATSPEQERMEVAAKRMLGFPIAYGILALPLSTYRFAGLAGHNWSLSVLLAVGAIYALGGLTNILLFSFTRNIISLERLSLGRVRPFSNYVGAGGNFLSFDGPKTSGKKPLFLSAKSFLEPDKLEAGLVTSDHNGNPAYIAVDPEPRRPLPARLWEGVRGIRLFGRRQAEADAAEEEVLDIRQTNLAHAILLRNNSVTTSIRGSKDSSGPSYPW